MSNAGDSGLASARRGWLHAGVVDAGERALWERLSAYRFDRAGDRLTFSERLAREQRWTPAFTHRVLEEYRRFVFLAMVAGHPVSPSATVDEAWHLHLTFTRTYWDEFCGKVLRAPLHHEPTRGGTEESEKFEDWYARTLASYAVWFGDAPPADVWPGVERHRREAKARKAQVDLQRFWVWPKPSVRVFQGVGVATAMGLLTGCGAWWQAAGNPFDLRGPEFLKLFFVSSAVCWVVAWLWREGILQRATRRVAGDAGGADAAEGVDPYVLAVLAGGRRRVRDLVLARLLGLKLLAIDSAQTEGPLVRRGFDVPPGLHPVEAGFLESLPGCSDKSDVRRGLDRVVAPLADQAERLGWAVPGAVWAAMRSGPFVLVMLPILAGLVKIGVGVSRGRPVGFLVISCAILGWLGWRIFARKGWRLTRRGRAVVAEARERAGNGVTCEAGDLTGMDERWRAAAILGMSALAGTAFAEAWSDVAVFDRLQRAAGADTSANGCGNSGCGGGGGCGSGCGGCGGGN